MNADEVLQELFWRLDDPAPEALLVGPRQLIDWPAAMLDTLVGQELLVDAPPADLIECPGCLDGHAAQPQRVGDRFIVHCPDAGVVDLRADDLRRWQISPRGVASHLARALQCTGAVRGKVPNRWYDLGETEVHGEPKRAAFVRGFQWRDAEAKLGEELRRLGPLDLLVAACVSEPVKDRAPDIALEDRARWHGTGITISFAGLCSEPTPRPAERYLFRVSGDHRELQFGRGPQFSIRRLKGIEDIAVLLREPGRKFHSAVLAGRLQPPGGSFAVDDGLEISLGDGMPLIDESGLAALTERIEEIDGILSALTNPEEAASLRDERDRLIRYQRSVTDVRGRPRASGGTQDRARLAVTGRVRAAIKAIGKYDENMSRHLDQFIQTGTFVVYDPLTPVSWEL